MPAELPDQLIISPINPTEVFELPVIGGPPGPPGTPGDGSNRYTHTQSIASTTWTVNHNFGYRPAAVSVFSVGGAEVEAAVTHTSINQCIISFAVSYSGTVEVL